MEGLHTSDSKYRENYICRVEDGQHIFQRASQSCYSRFCAESSVGWKGAWLARVARDPEITSNQAACMSPEVFYSDPNQASADERRLRKHYWVDIGCESAMFIGQTIEAKEINSVAITIFWRVGARMLVGKMGFAHVQCPPFGPASFSHLSKSFDGMHVIADLALGCISAPAHLYGRS